MVASSSANTSAPAMIFRRVSWRRSRARFLPYLGVHLLALGEQLFEFILCHVALIQRDSRRNSW
jgi:hypothetical protein